MSDEQRLAVAAVTVVLGLAAWVPEIRRVRRRRLARRYLRQFRERMIGDFNNLVSQALLSARPEVPPTWREMVAVETASCECPVCSKCRDERRKEMN